MPEDREARRPVDGFVELLVDDLDSLVKDLGNVSKSYGDKHPIAIAIRNLSDDVSVLRRALYGQRTPPSKEK